MMQRKKKWVTVFLNLKKQHLNKDVGLIPLVMQQYFFYKSKIVTAGVCDDFSNISGCTIEKIKVGFYGLKISMMLYIIRHARSIDVLNVYHFSLLETLLWVFPYKLLNRKGKAYLKMDLSTKYMADYTRNKWMLMLRRKAIKCYDLVSVESSVVRNYINSHYHNRIKLIPNGYFWGRFEPSKKSSGGKRRNEILHVSRLGAECKATNVLIEAFEKTLSFHDWNLRLVGPMDSAFKKWYDAKLKKNELLKRRIMYRGEIDDREKILREYQSCKIFVLCSEYESFGIVLVEALSNGNFIIGTDGINSIHDIVKDNKIGAICESNNIEALSESLIKSVCVVEKMSEDDFKYREEYARNYYSWIEICGRINHYLS